MDASLATTISTNGNKRNSIYGACPSRYQMMVFAFVCPATPARSWSFPLALGRGALRRRKPARGARWASHVRGTQRALGDLHQTTSALGRGLPFLFTRAKNVVYYRSYSGAFPKCVIVSP